MGLGDRPPSGAYPTATENGCTWYSDGHLYNKYGYRIESWQEKRDRLRREEEEEKERQREANQAYEQAEYNSHRGYDLDNDETLCEAGGDLLKGVAGVAIAGAAIAGAVTIAAEMSKNPNDPAGAVSKGVKNAFCILGMVGIIVVLCIATLIYAIFSTDETVEIGAVVLMLSILAGFCCIIGLIRVMFGKSFFISFKGQGRTYVDTTPLPKWVYAVIEAGSIVVLYKPVYDVIERQILKRNPDLDYARSWMPSQYYAVSLKISAGSIGLAAIIGVVICLGVLLFRAGGITNGKKSRSYR